MFFVAAAQSVPSNVQRVEVFQVLPIHGGIVRIQDKSAAFDTEVGPEPVLKVRPDCGRDVVGQVPENLACFTYPLILGNAEVTPGAPVPAAKRIQTSKALLRRGA